MATLSDKQLGNLQKKAEFYFQKRWPSKKQYKEDFASFCALKWVQGKGLDTSLYRLGIDFLRTFTFGDGAHGISDVLGQDILQLDWALSAGSQSIELNRFINKDALRGDWLTERERTFLILFFEWGFTSKEIADVLGLSETRMSQFIREVFSKQKKMINKGYL